MVCQQQTPDVIASVSNDEPMLRIELARRAISFQDVLNAPQAAHLRAVERPLVRCQDDGREPLMPSSDSIYDAFNVSYKLRWTHDFPSREETLRYAEEILTPDPMLFLLDPPRHRKS